MPLNSRTSESQSLELSILHEETIQDELPASAAADARLPASDAAAAAHVGASRRPQICDERRLLQQSTASAESTTAFTCFEPSQSIKWSQWLDAWKRDRPTDWFYSDAR